MAISNRNPNSNQPKLEWTVELNPNLTHSTGATIEVTISDSEGNEIRAASIRLTFNGDQIRLAAFETND